MGNKQQKGIGLLLALVLLLGVPVSAQQSGSSNYRIDEYQFGTGGEVDLQSNAYRGVGSAGSLGVGFASSPNYDAEAGFITADQPFLEMVVSGATVDFGVLSDASASSGAAQAGGCNCSFTVRTYLSNSYIVATMSDPPTSEGGAVLDAKTTVGVPSSSTSVEEFGMNLVDNSSPNIGADPVNDPGNSFADGEAATGYGTVNQFKYNKGDTIARSAKTAGNQAVGQTNYTISYIAKRKTLTEAGLYVMRHDIVVVATY